jgi:hypothetical protein
LDVREDEMAITWRKLHSEELHKLFSSLNVSRAIRSRRIR